MSRTAPALDRPPSRAGSMVSHAGSMVSHAGSAASRGGSPVDLPGDEHDDDDDAGSCSSGVSRGTGARAPSSSASERTSVHSAGSGQPPHPFSTATNTHPLAPASSHAGEEGGGGGWGDTSGGRSLGAPRGPSSFTSATVPAASVAPRRFQGPDPSPSLSHSSFPTDSTHHGPRLGSGDDSDARVGRGQDRGQAEGEEEEVDVRAPRSSSISPVTGLSRASNEGTDVTATLVASTVVSHQPPLVAGPRIRDRLPRAHKCQVWRRAPNLQRIMRLAAQHVNPHP